MPFTPVHTLIAIPFFRIKPKYVSATALVIGSMAPDLEYFLTMHGEKHHGHTWLGSLYFDVPLTIIVAFAFHLVVKKNLINNLPDYFQQRLQPLLKFDFLSYFKKHYLVFIASAWLGTWSHFFLDSFTHETGFFVRHLHYGGIFITLFGKPMPLFLALQMTISVVGLFILAGYLLTLKPDPHFSKTRVPDYRYWIATSLVTLCILSVHFGVFTIHSGFNNFVIATIAAFSAGLIVCGFVRFDNRLSTGW